MHHLIEGEFLVSPELLEYWYPGRKWMVVNGEYEIFKPTHMIEMVYQCEVLTSDLVYLRKDGSAFAPQEKGQDLLPLYCFDGEVWWNYINTIPKCRFAEIYVQETKWVENNSEIGWVYLIREGEEGPVKIGWSKNPNQRLSTLQTANPNKLSLLGVVPGHISEEKRLHKVFKEYRINGEWFRMSEDIQRFCERYTKRW